MNARPLVVGGLKQLADVIRDAKQAVGRRLLSRPEQPEPQPQPIPLYGLLNRLKYQLGLGGHALDGVKTEPYRAGAVPQDTATHVGSVA